MKWFGVGLVILGFGAAIFMWKERVNLFEKDPSKKLANLLSKDLKTLEAQKKLPKIWFEIQAVDCIPLSENAKDWLAYSCPKLFPFSNSGQYKLEVFMDEWIEDNKVGVTIRYNIVSLKNENTIWELGRTLILGPVPESYLESVEKN
jgi:hypothetical protein